MKQTIEEHAGALYWFAIIQAIRLLTYVGIDSGAEWIARVTGLRARVLRLAELLGITDPASSESASSPGEGIQE